MSAAMLPPKAKELETDEESRIHRLVLCVVVTETVARPLLPFLSSSLFYLHIHIPIHMSYAHAHKHVYTHDCMQVLRACTATLHNLC